MTPDERRADLIATTIGLLSSRSLGEITPEMIAREAGVSRALFYRYFSGLEEAFRESFSMITGLLKSSLETESGGNLHAQLSRGIGAYLEFASTFRESYVAIFTFGATGVGGPLAEHVEDVRSTIMRVMVERTGGELTPIFELTARGWMNATEQAVLRWLEHQTLGRDAMQQWLLDQFVAMLTVSAQRDPACARLLEVFLAESE